MNAKVHSKIYAQAIVHQTFPEFIKYAADQLFNLEVATFSFSNVYDADWRSILTEQKQKLAGFKGKISLHGVFQDLLIHSNDKEIAQISKERIANNLKLAGELNATQVVFHGNFNPFVKDQYYRKDWEEKNASFWKEMLDCYNGGILIENCWEPSPAIFCGLLDKVNSPRLNLCFDIGHANVYSNVPIKEWFVMLGHKMPYIHISDNFGEVDQHLEVGKGKINWQEFSTFAQNYATNPELVFEMVTLEKTEESLRYLKENAIYPFQ